LPLPLSPARVAAGVALVLALVVGAVLLLRSPDGPPPEVSMTVAGGPDDPAATSTSSSVPSEVVAHAAGAVAAPGVYRLAGGARVGDLVSAAGGPLPGADLDQVNLAAPVTDGERVYVPVEGEVVTPPSGTADPGPVDLNAATAEQLDALPGVGPSTAAAILDERERRGGFRSVDELLDVRGIGPAKLEQLRELVRV
jgi:competence protein ComEA